MTSLSDINGIHPTIRSYAPSERFVEPTTTIGIEIEVEGADSRLNLDQELWRMTSDGSLRNNGLELVSTPLFGEDVVTALQAAESELTKAAAIISTRCGLHIHIDVSAFTTDQLLSMSCALALVEKFIYKYVGEDRRDNIFCLPLSDTALLLPFYNNIKYGHDNSSIVRAIKKTQKYSGFNILPILTQGSVEFRHHKGTFSTEEIIAWINIIMRIREAGLNHSALDLVNMSYNQIISVLLEDGNREFDERMYNRQDHLDGWLVAKDILNFNKLEEVWNTVKDVYINENRINLQGVRN